MKPFLCRIAETFRLIFDWFMAMIDSLFNEHKFVRRFIVFWAVAIITWAVLHALPRLETGNLLTAFGLVVGILATVIGFYQYLRNKDGD